MLKIKDENGNWISIPVIKGEKGDKGDKGDDYTLTDTDKQEIAGNASDIAYSEVLNLIQNNIIPEMGNEQSGTIASPYAVVHYVNDYAELKPQYSLVYTTTLTEAIEKSTNQVENYLDGTKPVRLVVTVPPNTTFSNNYVAAQISFTSGRSITVRAANWKENSAYTTGVWDCKMYAGTWNVVVTPFDKQVTTILGDLRVVDKDKVRYVNITAGGNLPIGTVIEFWGTPK